MPVIFFLLSFLPSLLHPSISSHSLLAVQPWLSYKTLKSSSKSPDKTLPEYESENANDKSKKTTRFVEATARVGSIVTIRLGFNGI